MLWFAAARYSCKYSFLQKGFDRILGDDGEGKRKRWRVALAQVARQLELEKATLLERKRREQDERRRKQEELDHILLDNRRKARPAGYSSLQKFFYTSQSYTVQDLFGHTFACLEPSSKSGARPAALPRAHPSRHNLTRSAVAKGCQIVINRR